MCLNSLVSFSTIHNTHYIIRKGIHNTRFIKQPCIGMISNLSKMISYEENQVICSNKLLELAMYNISMFTISTVKRMILWVHSSAFGIGWIIYDIPVRCACGQRWTRTSISRNLKRMDVIHLMVFLILSVSLIIRCSNLYLLLWLSFHFTYQV